MSLRVQLLVLQVAIVLLVVASAGAVASTLQHRQLRDADREIARLAEGESSRADLEALEAQLVERGEYIQNLENDLRKLERFGRELTLELAEARAVEQLEVQSAAEERIAELTGKLDRLAQVNAAFEADLVASEWALAELRARLSS